MSFECGNNVYNKDNADFTTTYTTYYRVFMNNFNLGFGNLKTDVCSYCVGQKEKIKHESDNDKKRVLITFTF